MNQPFDPSTRPVAWERQARVIGSSVFVLALGVLVGAGARDASSREHDTTRYQGQDRQTVVLSAAQRDSMLQEMRGLLAAMQGVMDGAQAMDITKMHAASQAGGVAAAVHDESLLRTAPAEFRARLMQVHTAFDVMGDAIRGFTARDTVLTHLSKISQMCVSCHGTYKFGVKQ
jgi:cytochrome c556